MHLKPVSLLASALWVLGPAGADADGRMTLTSAELDDVTAVASYAPAQVGELREARRDRSNLDHPLRELVQDIGERGDPVRPVVIGDHLMPVMAAATPPAASVPARPSQAGEPATRPMRFEAARMLRVPANRSFGPPGRLSSRP